MKQVSIVEGRRLPVCGVTRDANGHVSPAAGWRTSGLSYSAEAPPTVILRRDLRATKLRRSLKRSLSPIRSPQLEFFEATSPSVYRCGEREEPSEGDHNLFGAVTAVSVFSAGRLQSLFALEERDSYSGGGSFPQISLFAGRIQRDSDDLTVKRNLSNYRVQ